MNNFLLHLYYLPKMILNKIVVTVLMLSLAMARLHHEQ